MMITTTPPSRPGRPPGASRRRSRPGTRATAGGPWPSRTDFFLPSQTSITNGILGGFLSIGKYDTIAQEREPLLEVPGLSERTSFSLS